MSDSRFNTYVGSLAAGGSADLWFEMQMAVRSTHHYGGLSALAGALDVTREAIRYAGGLGLLRIATTGRYFEPAAPGGDLAVIVPDYRIDEDGDGAELVDLVAFRVGNQSRTWVRTGYARALGAWNADAILDATPNWRLPNDPPPPVLRLYRTPLSWLRALCDGACILNPAWAEYLLGGIGRVQPEGDRHAHDFHRVLRKHPVSLPRIVVPREPAA